MGKNEEGEKIMTVRKKKTIDGKIYTSYGSYINKNIPLREAKHLRKEGWNARIIKEGK